MDFISSFQLITILTAAALSLIVFVHGRNRKVNRLFFLTALTILLWIISSTFSDKVKTEQVALFWAQMAIVGPFLFCPLFLYFTLNFPKATKKISHTKKILIFFSPLAPLVFTFTKYNIENVVINSWGTDFTPGILYYVLDFYLLGYIGGALVHIAKQFHVTKEKEEKLQIRYFVLGIASLVVIGLMANSLLPTFFSYSKASVYGPSLALVVFSTFTAYAIFKHHLFSVRVIAIEMLTGATWLILIANLLAARAVNEYLFRGFVFGAFSVLSYFLIRSVLKEEHLAQQQYEMVATVSHQLRTPLTPIVGLASMIANGEYDDNEEERKKTDQRIFFAARRLNNIVNDFLKLFEFEGENKIEKERIDLVNLLRDVMESVKDNYKKANLYLRLTKEPKNTDFIVYGDHKLLREVFANLLDNAQKYTQSGGTTIRLQKNHRNISVSIKDTGIGFDAEDGGQLFTKFFRSSSARSIRPDGSGLGLAIVKEILEAHKAKIFASSEGMKKGATFTVTFSNRNN